MPANPLRVWFDRTQTPREDFIAAVGISQSYLTLLLLPNPPWPSRPIMRAIIKETGGFVTVDAWLKLDDPPPQKIKRGARGKPARASR